MPDLNFDCPACGQNLDAPEDMAGQMIHCPACDEVIAVPGAEPPPPPPEEEPTEPEGEPPEDPGMQPIPEEFKKTSTVRIDLPSDYGLPRPKPRIIKIKRTKR